MFGRMFFLAGGYLVTIVLARGLGPAEYGVYGVILSILVWIEQIGRFGIPEAVAKLGPEDEERRPRIEQGAQTLLLIVFLPLFALAWLAAPILADLFRVPQGTALFRLAIIDIPFAGCYFIYQGIALGRRNFGAISGGLAIYSLTKLIGVLVALLLGLSIVSALVVNILGTIGALLFLSLRVAPLAFRPSFANIRGILYLSLPVGLFSLAVPVVSNLDLWSLKIIGSENAATIGMYVAALNIARVPALAFSAINGVILPSLSMALAKEDRALVQHYVQGTGRFLWVTLLPACVLLTLTSKELMILLYSDYYSAGASFLAFQVFALASFGVTQVFSEMLVACGNPYLTACVAIGHIPISLFLNLALIPHFGALGASTALILTALCIATATGCLVFQRLGPIIEFTTFLRVFLATLLMVLVSTQITAAGPWVALKCLFLLSVYGAALVALGELTWDDLQPLALWRVERA
jgi:stage V sporulation protein B